MGLTARQRAAVFFLGFLVSGLNWIFFKRCGTLIRLVPGVVVGSQLGRLMGSGLASQPQGLSWVVYAIASAIHAVLLTTAVGCVQQVRFSLSSDPPPRKALVTGTVLLAYVLLIYVAFSGA